MAKILCSPSKYVQGAGEMKKLGEYAQKYGKKALVLITESGYKRIGDVVNTGFEGYEITPVYEYFNRECSKNEINRLVDIMNEKGCDVVIMKHASVINDTVMERVANFIKEGMTEKEVADFIDAEYLKEGASGVSFDTIVCFGPNAADQHHTPSETRTLKAGECVLIDMGCVWKGYCSDMTRTFYCKSVDDEQAAIHDLVRTAVEKAEAVIKPGMRFCDIDAQARDLIDEAGYSEYWRIRLGHFIGQEDHEYGDVSPINKNVAEPGMIFSIEPGIYIEGKYGVRVEDLVLVTEDGHELLNAVDKKYRIVG